MNLGQVERILILAKTYPSPSASYVETSCVAGINSQGDMRRLFPIPFRMIEEGKQFKKWQWINARVVKANRDHRPESHRIFVDTINLSETIDTHKGWGRRVEWLDKLPYYDDIQKLNADQQKHNVSLALFRPINVQRLEIVKARDVEWTADEKAKLIQQQTQGNLFSEADARQQVNTLRKLPFDFYYRFTCATTEANSSHRYKIIDWEAGALYWNCQERHGQQWEKPFRQKLEDELLGTDIMFLLGNQQRFRDQWMIISLIYPPKQKHSDHQAALF